MSELSEDVKEGGVTDPVDALLDAFWWSGTLVGWKPFWNENLRGFLNSVGISKCPRFQIKAEC